MKMADLFPLKLYQFTLMLLFQERRPYLATDCEDLRKAEKWRRQIIGEVSKKVAQIQNGRSACSYK